MLNDNESENIEIVKNLQTSYFHSSGAKFDENDFSFLIFCFLKDNEI